MNSHQHRVEYVCRHYWQLANDGYMTADEARGACEDLRKCSAAIVAMEFAATLEFEETMRSITRTGRNHR